MVRHFSEMQGETKHAPRGGAGDAEFRHLFSADELGGRADLFSVIKLHAGDRVGIHAHTDDGEVYYVLDGRPTVTEDGVEFVLDAGDAEFCAGGHTHGIENRTDEPAIILAVVMKDR